MTLLLLFTSSASGSAVTGTAVGALGGLTGTVSGTVKVYGTAAGNLGALTGTVVTATTYYISNSGSDSDDGQSTGDAWQTLSKHNSSSFNDGDIVLLERGGLWRESLVPKEGVTYGAYGSGAKPSIRGSAAAGSWTANGSNLWYIGSISTDPEIVYFDGVLGRRRTSSGALTQALDYFWDDPADRLHVYSPTDPGSTYTLIEYGVRTGIIGNYEGVNVTFEDLDVRHNRGNITFAVYEAPVDVAFNRVDFTGLGGYGIQINGDATGTVDECTFTDWGVRRASTGDNYAVQVIGDDATLDVTDSTFTLTGTLPRADVMAINADIHGWLRTCTGNTLNLGDGTNGTSDEGILVYGPGVHATQTEIAYNTILNAGGMAIALQALDADGATCTYLMHHNVITNACVADESDTEAIRLADFTTAQDVTVYYNVVNGTYNGSNDHHGIRVNAATGVKLYNNTVVGADDGIRICNDWAIRAPSATGKNNLSSANRGPEARLTAGTFTEDHNLFFGSVTGFTADATDVLTDPLLYASLIPSSTSPAKDAGTVVSGITPASLVDIGAYEAAVGGVAAGNLGALTGTAAGHVKVYGVAASSLGTLSGTASGQVKVYGAVTGPLGALTGTASGAVKVTGAAGGSLGALVGAASGLRTTRGTAVGALGALTGTAAGKVTVYGAATGSLGGLAGTATDGNGGLVSGTAVGNLGALTGSALGTVKVYGSGAGLLGALVGTATGTVKVVGVAAGSLGALSGTASGQVKVYGTATCSLGFTGTATGRRHVYGSGLGALGALVGSVVVNTVPNPDEHPERRIIRAAADRSTIRAGELATIRRR